MSETISTLRAYHGDPTVKQRYLARVEAHAAADEIVQGIGWERGKGCAVGCTLHKYEHGAYETELGLPRWLARLEDGMFEALPAAEAKRFPAAFLAAIPVGADVEAVRLPFLAWLMDDPTRGLAHQADVDAEVRALAAEVGDRLRTGREMDGPAADALTERLRDARDAWDAWAAWDARAARDARDAWDARAARDAWDAWAAWDARAARAARAAFALASRDELLRLLAAAPVAEVV